MGLALELENIAAETYVKDTVLAKSATNKALLASIMGIEAQHVAMLRPCRPSSWRAHPS